MNGVMGRGFTATGGAGVRRGAASPRLTAAMTFGASEPRWLTEGLLDAAGDAWTGTQRPSPSAPSWTGPNAAWNSEPQPIRSGMRGLLLETDEGAPVCAAIGCGSKPRFWRKTARPVFEGRWACGRACLETLVRSAVRRELAHAADTGQTASPHPHRIPLGLVLLSQGAISEAQLRASLAAQRQAGSGRIGDWLVRQGAAAEAEVLRALARQWGCPVLREEMLVPEKAALAMPPLLREQLHLQPLCTAGRRYLYAGFTDQLDAAAVFALERMSGLTVVPGVLSSAEYGDCVRRLDAQPAVPCEQIAAAGEDDIVAAIQRLLQAQEPAASRMVGIHGRMWLRLWLEPGVVGASGTLPVSQEDMLDVLIG